MKAEFLEFLQEASAGQPWDQEPPEAANICYWQCDICKTKSPGSLTLLASLLWFRSNVIHWSVTPSVKSSSPLLGTLGRNNVNTDQTSGECDTAGLRWV